MRKSVFVIGLLSAVLSTSANSLKNVHTSGIVWLLPPKKVEIDSSKLPEKITKSISETNKQGKITKAYQLIDDAGILTGYEVVVLTEKKEEVFKYDKNGKMLKEVITPNPNAPKPEEKK